MKRPRTGIWSTQCCTIESLPIVLNKIDNPDDIPIVLLADNDSDSDFPDAIPPTHANDEESDNVFVFAAFADIHTGILYIDLTGTFRFMSLEGNVCFLVVYHYETNSILALPIAKFSNNSILHVYQQQFELLESRGHKIKLNMMDNQASHIIKQYLTTKQCNNLLVKLNNHRVNAAKQAIQTFKAHFISALATTNSEFLLQLWDRLTPQLVNTLNMLRCQHMKQSMIRTIGTDFPSPPQVAKL
jgi:hypothetical protein